MKLDIYLRADLLYDARIVFLCESPVSGAVS